MLSIQNIKYRYPGGETLSFNDLEIKKGNKVLITGNSGTGKTTLLHLLAGILTPLSGEIRQNDVILNQLQPRERDKFRGKNTGMIFQKHIFMEGMSMRKNLLLSSGLTGQKASVNEHLNKLLDQLDILHLQNKKPSELSQGELQRFSIARALALQPSWVLADEPTSSLDDKNCNNFVDLISKVGSEAGWVIATHDKRLKDHFETVYSL
jgi:putative ABC transport system ATP-binding protein